MSISDLYKLAILKEYSERAVVLARKEFETALTSIEHETKAELWLRDGYHWKHKNKDSQSFKLESDAIAAMRDGKLKFS